MSGGDDPDITRRHVSSLWHRSIDNIVRDLRDLTEYVERRHDPSDGDYADTAYEITKRVLSEMPNLGLHDLIRRGVEADSLLPPASLPSRGDQ